MDYVAQVDQGFPSRHGAPLGGMKLVEEAELKALLAQSERWSLAPGGSGANTARALSFLIGEERERYGSVVYTGAVGDDEAGRRFAFLLKEHGVETYLAEKKLPTGVSAILLTPDHERTMLTLLGASQELAPEDLRTDLLAESALVYTTGYLAADSRGQAILERLATTAESQRIVFDLADQLLVRENREFFTRWIPASVDYLLGNREELAALTGCEGSDAELIRSARQLAPSIALKVGRGGSLILDRGRLLHIPGEQVVVQDETGAGDAFAAGLLYGLLRGVDMAAAGRLANRIASRIVTMMGYHTELLDRRELLEALQGSD